MTGSDLAVRVQDLSKRFEIYRRPLDFILEVVTRRPRHSDFWALRSVSFDVHPGEVVGIVGRNGAGKSTLLKIITGTLEKTSGVVDVNGQVSSLLELGTGFHPEYTGRDNVYLGGLCLGMSRAEINDKFGWVVEFSELSAVMDQPLKTYSTGMRARLAFSTAVAARREMLIVDEALSVGDVKFQRKCFALFDEFRRGGHTILLVTHVPSVVNAVCTRALYLRQGQLVADGLPKDVTGLYLKDLLGGTDETSSSPQTVDTGQQGLIYGNGGVQFLDMAILDDDGQRVTSATTGSTYAFCSRLLCRSDTVDDLNVGISIRTVHGVEVFGVNPISQRVEMPTLRAGDILNVRVDVRMWLAPGHYFLTFGAWGAKHEAHYDRRVDAVHLVVLGECGVLQDTIVNLQPRYQVSVQPSRGVVPELSRP